MAENPRQLVQVVHTQVEDFGSYWKVHTERTFDDGAVEQGGHILAKDIMEWRAAEYGIDASDVDTLLDIVLVEPYLNDEEESTGKTLITAGTIAEARRDHIARITAAKLRLRIITRTRSPEPAVRAFLADKLKVNEDRANELDALRVNSEFDDQIIKIKAKMSKKSIEGHRAVLRAEKPTRRERFRQMDKEIDRGR